MSTNLTVPPMLISTKVIAILHAISSFFDIRKGIKEKKTKFVIIACLLKSCVAEWTIRIPDITGLVETRWGREGTEPIEYLNDNCIRVITMTVTIHV